MATTATALYHLPHTCLTEKAVTALLNAISSTQVGPYGNPSKGFLKPKGKDHIKDSFHWNKKTNNTPTQTTAQNTPTNKQCWKTTP